MVRSLWVGVDFNGQVTSSGETSKEQTCTAAEPISGTFNQENELGHGAQNEKCTESYEGKDVGNKLCPSPRSLQNWFPFETQTETLLSSKPKPAIMTLGLMFPSFQSVYFTKTICSNSISEVSSSFNEPNSSFWSFNTNTQPGLYLFNEFIGFYGLWASFLVQGQNFSWVQWKQINPRAGKLPLLPRTCFFWDYWEKQKQG